MNLLHSIPPHNFGLSIILMVLVIRGVFWVPQTSVNKNMKRMQAVTTLPEVVKLREKYKDDPQKMNVEMMSVYRNYGINPMGGCLPMLIQMPVFFGFYAMLQSAVELRGAPFLFIPDLSQPWTLFRIPGLDWPLNPLPLIMGLTSLWQMSITPTTSMDKMQAAMLKFMPLMFVAFCYNFSSALALYWTVQNLVGIFQLYHSKNMPLPKLEKSTRPKSRWASLMESAQAQAEAQRRLQGKR
jgi:YidC/Oxa1 family membrane protein insertase